MVRIGDNYHKYKDKFVYKKFSYDMLHYLHILYCVIYKATIKYDNGVNKLSNLEAFITDFGADPDRNDPKNSKKHLE